MTRHSLTRSLHDVGLAAWFGGTLANAVALNPAAGQADSSSARGAVANTGWDRWTPVNAAAIGVHLVGAAGQLAGDRRRVRRQSGVGSTAVVKTLLTGAALGVTGYARALGRTVSAETAMPVSSGTEPEAGTPPQVAAAQRRLQALQWAVPGLTGALVVVSALAGEQQRASEAVPGVLRSIVG